VDRLLVVGDPVFPAALPPQVVAATLVLASRPRRLGDLVDELQCGARQLDRALR
jgi:hypothetical protein